MARATTDGDSTNAFVRPASRRLPLAAAPTDGGTTATISGAARREYPNTWVRLQRVGNVFTAYYGTNGTSWTQSFSHTHDAADTRCCSAWPSARTARRRPTVSAVPRRRRHRPGRARARRAGQPDGDRLVDQPDRPRLAGRRQRRQLPRRAQGPRRRRLRRDRGERHRHDATRTPAAPRTRRTSTACGPVSASGTVFSGYSNVASAHDAARRRQPAGASRPTSTPSRSRTTQINLSWGASSGATSYRIERRILGAATFDEIASGVTTTSYQDTGRTPETTYEYRVRAENAGGLSRLQQHRQRHDARRHDADQPGHAPRDAPTPTCATARTPARTSASRPSFTCGRAAAPA